MNKSPSLLKRFWIVAPLIIASFTLGAFISESQKNVQDIGYEYGYIKGQAKLATEIGNEIGLKVDPYDFDKKRYKLFRRLKGETLFIYYGEEFKSIAVAE